jgi:CTP synthase (UTP-ammonia lyase)
MRQRSRQGEDVEKVTTMRDVIGGGGPLRVAVVGDYNPRNPTHTATDAALAHVGLGIEWIGTDQVGADPAARLGSYAGLWIAPASPYRDLDGALAAVRHARERGVPLVGT